MSKYTPVSLPEMRAFLREDKGWQRFEHPTAHEVVLDWAIPRRAGCVVRVYTSIQKDDGCARRCGRDAIRVCAVDTLSCRGLVKSTRVFRVEGWRKNLRRAVERVLAAALPRAIVGSC